MADGDGRVLLKQQQRHRLAHNIAAAYNYRVSARYRNLIALQKLNHSGGRAGPQPWAAGGKQTGIVRMKSVDILFRRHRQQRLLRVDMRRQRQLDEDTVDVSARVQPRDNFQKAFRCERRIARDRFVMEPELFRRFRLVADVNRGSGIVAHQNNRQPRRASGLRLHRRYARTALLLDLVANRVSIENQTHIYAVSISRTFVSTIRRILSSPKKVLTTAGRSISTATFASSTSMVPVSGTEM